MEVIRAGIGLIGIAVVGIMAMFMVPVVKKTIRLYLLKTTDLSREESKFIEKAGAYVVYGVGVSYVISGADEILNAFLDRSAVTFLAGGMIRTNVWYMLMGIIIGIVWGLDRTSVFKTTQGQEGQK